MKGTIDRCDSARIAIQRGNRTFLGNYLRAVFGRTMRIVGLSAHAGQREHDEAVAAGMDAFLVKPIELDALIAALLPAVALVRAVETSRADLLDRLRTQFRGAAAAEGAAIAAAIAERNFPAARARAHHLLNSAAVVRDDWLFAACARIERVAIAGNAEELAAAWQTCEAALKPWVKNAGASGADAKILSAN